MELIEAYKIIEKYLADTNKELGFSKVNTEDETLTFKGNKGIYRLSYDTESNVLSTEYAFEDDGNETEFKNVSKSLFELDRVDERDCRSTANETAYEIKPLFAEKKKANLDSVKMPKGISRGKAKSGLISYDVDSLANRFGVLYPEFKDDIKQNIVDYGDFLPETFFKEIGTPKVLDVIKNGDKAEQKKLFKMLNEVYEDGTNEVQDIIGVSILGEMKNDPKMMAVANEYMSEYMGGPVREINKITGKKNKYTKKLSNPPAYKPKKKKQSKFQSALVQAQQQNR
ncbi:MAG: hypothetical protein K2K42_01430 [Eubacterium sp.]|nr:hypothetical protein [Eubacterium sp.]